MAIKTAIIDQDNFIINGIVSYLSTHPTIDVVMHSNTITELIDSNISVDVVVLDFFAGHIPDNINILFNSNHLGSRVKLLAYIRDHQYGRKKQSLLTMGIHVLLKSAPPCKLAESIIELNMKKTDSPILDLRTISKKASLTPMELFTLILLSYEIKGYELAMLLSRSQKTISAHKRSAMRKLGISSDLALMFFLNELKNGVRDTF
ncbi:hypothetical protein [Serratia marcescens]|uniref:hypothetical protein n=1 Tax=Serratia marcescens TaxID=615 RepID=UPI00313E12AB